MQALEKDELMVSQGEDYKDIAAKLGISENMVKHHVKRVVDKLHR
ncbi:MAG TPA: LuxR C-terminal-related transcriptional regulator [Bacillota bacterium]|nr:LuxR C-terminal-related transcriptional regulator [Bacillota bacterium]HPX69340.1 LuxR C-terminal-related transcriptional regulator [Bacillota bacterium]HQA65698.1 LuxR C-terminal-related transcriptional regulator [Bacillota bacterium]HQO42584.1 LuxR C-terminal-related transcriptional regulator [Bacillota bacterium]